MLCVEVCRAVAFLRGVLCVDVIFSEKNTLLRSMTQTPMPETPTERETTHAEKTSDQITSATAAYRP